MINVIAIDDLQEVLAKLDSIANVITGGGGGGSAINYSTSEVNTGVKWIDGKYIYQKTIQGTLVADSTSTIVLTDASIDTMISGEGLAWADSPRNNYMISSSQSSSRFIGISQLYDNIKLHYPTYISNNYNNYTVTIRYTKI